MKVYVDSELCNGCGPCADICPEVFEINEEGTAEVKMEDIPAELRQSCREAAENCPTEAISIKQ
ncbi:MAG: ferredoxin [Planctomycetota bacterium]|jgi:ferredoxin